MTDLLPEDRTASAPSSVYKSTMPGAPLAIPGGHTVYHLVKSLADDDAAAPASGRAVTSNGR